MSEAALVVKEVTLRDKYVFEGDRIFLTGTQALVRLMLAQARYDNAIDRHI